MLAQHATTQLLPTKYIEVSAVSSENLEYFEGKITNTSSSSVEDLPLKEMPSSGEDVVSYEKISSFS